MDIKKEIHFISKTFRRIINNYSLPQSQQLTQATDIQDEEIRMSINLSYQSKTTAYTQIS